MSPERRNTKAYWHAGGSIESRYGPLTADRAVGLFAFYACEAIAGFERGDLSAARYCAGSSLEVADAIIESEVWNRSAAAMGARAAGEFSPLWLTHAFIVKKLLNNLDRREWS
jgi:hypothetical protein